MPQGHLGGVAGLVHRGRGPSVGLAASVHPFTRPVARPRRAAPPVHNVKPKTLQRVVSTCLHVKGPPGSARTEGPPRPRPRGHGGAGGPSVGTWTRGGWGVHSLCRSLDINTATFATFPEHHLEICGAAVVCGDCSIERVGLTQQTGHVSREGYVWTKLFAHASLNCPSIND